MRETDTGRAFDTAVLDLDGTLVDSNYQHVVAWRSAFLRVGIDAPAWRIHRAIGMGGDRLVTEVAGRAAEAAVGDDVRKLHGSIFEDLLHQVVPTEGAADLLQALRERGLRVVVASSGEEEMAQRLLSLVDSGESLSDWVAGAQAESSKPAPDLLDLALQKVSGTSAVMIGDAVWDVRTAAARSFPCLGLRTGGITGEELLRAGAFAVFDTPAQLVDELDDTLAGLARRTGQSSTGS